MNTDLKRFTEACEYPGELAPLTVEKHLREYLKALSMERRVMQLPFGWKLSEQPSLNQNVMAILEDFAKRTNGSASDARAARAASDASDALDARAARAASDARAGGALHRFAQWCVFRGDWWWAWDLSWITTTFLGAKQVNRENVIQWSQPLFEAFLAGAWFLYWTEDVLYWVAKPIVHTESQAGRKRLHNETGPALECDVENLYFWHGVLVPAFVVVRPEWITLAHIESEENAEVRRMMIERYGQARYLADSNAAEIHRDDFGTLYRKDIAGDEPLVMVKVVNSTPEPDGTFKDYFLRVPPTMQRAHQAVAWTFGKEEHEYDPCLQT